MFTTEPKSSQTVSLRTVALRPRSVRPRSVRKAAVRALAPLAAVALLAGCSTPSGDTAFDVNGERVRLSAIDDAAAGCVRASGGQVDVAGSKTFVAQMLLAGQVAQAAAKQEGFTITPATRTAALKELGGTELASDPDCATAVNGYADYAALMSRMGQQRAMEVVRGLDVQVNPRFGQWNPAKGTFTNESGSLSREDLGLGQVYGG